MEIKKCNFKLLRRSKKRKQFVQQVLNFLLTIITCRFLKLFYFYYLPSAQNETT